MVRVYLRDSRERRSQNINRSECEACEARFRVTTRALVSRTVACPVHSCIDFVYVLLYPENLSEVKLKSNGK